MSCTDRNPLAREGTSQLNRVLAALDVHYADVDERTTSDLILFAKRYAAYLNFYNESNVAVGDWQPLMMMDESVSLATLSNINVQRISDYKKLLYKNTTLATNDADAKQQFKFLFDALFSLVKIIDDQLKLLPDDDYKKVIEDIVSTKLRLHLANLQEKFFEKFKTETLLDYSANELDSNAPFEIESRETFKRVDLSPVWQGLSPDLEITIPALPAAREKIIYIINHNLFNSTIDSLLKGVALIVSRAKDLFEKTLIDFPQHAPHYALFLTFTKLFKTAQDDLNLYTKRHLDFYYKDVLQLKNKNPQPDTAHLTFELQKNVEQELLKKDILFKGGKDITGKDISYRLTDDVVLNKATVAKIHAQQIDIKKNLPLKVFPIANSEDGEGAKLISADKSWFTFGALQKVKTAKAGFAIASNILFLNEGKRDVTITITFENNIEELKNITAELKCFDAELTGKKDWLNKNATATYDDTKKQIVFTISIEPNDPAIIPYTEKIHKQNFETNLPLLKIYLNQDAPDAMPYSVLCNKKINSVDIKVEVTGVKDLMLSSDKGSIDASKPFKPFGDFPETGAGFYIGSKELFQKNLTEIKFNFDWKPIERFSHSTSSKKAIAKEIDLRSVLDEVKIEKLPTGVFQPAYIYVLSYEDNYSPVKAEYLYDGLWKEITPVSSDKISFPPGNFFKTTFSFEKNESLNPTTYEGFLRLKFDKPGYSLQDHLDRVSNQLSDTKISTATDGTSTINIPSTPVPKEVVLNSFSINYVASSSIKFTETRSETDNNLFYHLSPFGYAEVFNDGSSVSSSVEKTEKYSLLADVINNGELFIGFENAEPDTVVTVLFQVADGSSNPLKNKETLLWYYLSNNEWIEFEKSDIIDRTNDFTQSGVVTITLPAIITNQNTLLGKDLHWIKVAVMPNPKITETNIDAVCRMILIQAQAASVELVQDESNQIEFRQIIPANTISKLVESNAAIKTITQPFDSFNGRVRESDEHFYVRVSERLRHKQRAISIWDYEHILLEQFPQLYKIKCLNHSGFYTKNGTKFFCENFPGHVTIVPIPDLKNNTHVNLLKPYTPIGLLNNIGEYLKKINSPFVTTNIKPDENKFDRLHVTNPQFEEVRLDFQVKFYEHLDDSFYKQLLDKEIEKFLCPWAFDTNVEIPFGSKIIKSVLLNFIEERPYVDFLTCFEMHHLLRNSDGNDFTYLNVEEAIATTSRSILVSYNNESGGLNHNIQSMTSCNC